MSIIHFRDIRAEAMASGDRAAVAALGHFWFEAMLLTVFRETTFSIS
jgi:hypothetical protein